MRLRCRGLLFALLTTESLALGACATGRSGPPSGPGATEQTLSELFNLSAVYQRLGRLASPGGVPFVGSYTFLAGRGDSTLLRLGLSFENRAFSFQRDGRSFAARYRVQVTLQHAGSPTLESAKDEVIRVASFQEAQRTDESVLFHQGLVLAPGSYTLTVTVRDLLANAAGRAERQLEVPAFEPGSFSAPAMVYEAPLRTTVADTSALILNPRGTVAHGGGDTLHVYVEGYRLSGPTQVPVEVRDDRDSVVYRTQLEFTGGKGLEAKVFRLDSDAPPLGELTITVGSGAAAKKTTALVSFAHGWVVTNYENLLSLLRYFPYGGDLIGQLRSAKPADRPALWRKFWTSTDPIPETPENEALDRYFTRIAIANERFREEGGEGWRTERGEVYITLGEPDQVFETPPATDQRIIQWIYNEYRVVLYFTGTLGFSRIRLTPQSRAEFARARAQAMRQPARR